MVDKCNTVEAGVKLASHRYLPVQPTHSEILCVSHANKRTRTRTRASTVPFRCTRDSTVTRETRFNELRAACGIERLTYIQPRTRHSLPTPLYSTLPPCRHHCRRQSHQQKQLLFCPSAGVASGRGQWSGCNYLFCSAVLAHLIHRWA